MSVTTYNAAFAMQTLHLLSRTPLSTHKMNRSQFQLSEINFPDEKVIVICLKYTVCVYAKFNLIMKYNSTNVHTISQSVQRYEY